MWRTVFEQRMTLICLREGSDEIVAMNANYVFTKGDAFHDQIIAQVKNVRPLLIFGISFFIASF